MVNKVPCKARSVYDLHVIWYSHLQQEVYLLSGRAYLGVTPLQPVSPVVQAEKGVSLALPSVIEGAGQGPHTALDLLHVVLGSLEPLLQVTHTLTHFLDVLPDTWSQTGEGNGHRLKGPSQFQIYVCQEVFRP